MQQSIINAQDIHSKKKKTESRFYNTSDGWVTQSKWIYQFNINPRDSMVEFAKKGNQVQKNKIVKLQEENKFKQDMSNYHKKIKITRAKKVEEQHKNVFEEYEKLSQKLDLIPDDKFLIVQSDLNKQPFQNIPKQKKTNFHRKKPSFEDVQDIKEENSHEILSENFKKVINSNQSQKISQEFEEVEIPMFRSNMAQELLEQMNSHNKFSQSLKYE